MTIANKLFINIKCYRDFEWIVTNQYCMQSNSISRLNSGIACYISGRKVFVKFKGIKKGGVGAQGVRK